jgi:iron transport multicopper oxidase
MTDSSKGLVAFKAVLSGTTLVEITPLPRTGAPQKFQSPSFGNNRVYVTSGEKVMGVGGPPGPSVIT